MTKILNLTSTDVETSDTEIENHIQSSSSSSSESSVQICEIVTSQENQTQNDKDDSDCIVIIDENEFNQAAGKSQQRECSEDLTQVTTITESRLDRVLRTLKVPQPRTTNFQLTKKPSVSAYQLANTQYFDATQSNIRKSQSSFCEIYHTCQEDILPSVAESQNQSEHVVLSSKSPSMESYYSLNEDLLSASGGGGVANTDYLEIMSSGNQMDTSIPLTPKLIRTPVKMDEKLKAKTTVKLVKLTSEEIDEWCRRKTTPTVYFDCSVIDTDQSNKRKRTTSTTTITETSSVASTSSDDFRELLKNRKRKKVHIIDSNDDNAAEQQQCEILDTSVSSVSSNKSKTQNQTEPPNVSVIDTPSKQRIVCRIKIDRQSGKGISNIVDDNPIVDEDTQQVPTSTPINNDKPRLQLSNGKTIPPTTILDSSTESEHEEKRVVVQKKVKTLQKKQVPQPQQKTTNAATKTKPVVQTDEIVENNDGLPKRPFKIPRIQRDANNNEIKQTEKPKTPTKTKRKSLTPKKPPRKPASIQPKPSSNQQTVVAPQIQTIEPIKQVEIQSVPKPPSNSEVIIQPIHPPLPPPPPEPIQTTTTTVEPEKQPDQLQLKSAIVDKDPFRIRLNEQPYKIDLDMFYLVNANVQYNTDVNTTPRELNILQLTYDERIELFNLIRRSNKTVNIFELFGFASPSELALQQQQQPQQHLRYMANLNLNSILNDSDRCFNILLNCLNCLNVNELYMVYMFFMDRTCTSRKTITAEKHPLSSNPIIRIRFQNIQNYLTNCVNKSIDASVSTVIHRPKYGVNNLTLSIHKSKPKQKTRLDLNNNNNSRSNLVDVMNRSKNNNQIEAVDDVDEMSDSSCDDYDISNDDTIEADYEDDTMPSIKRLRSHMYQNSTHAIDFDFFKRLRKIIPDEDFCDELQARRARFKAVTEKETYDLLTDKTLKNYKIRNPPPLKEQQQDNNSSAKPPPRFASYRTPEPPKRGVQSKIEKERPTGIPNLSQFKTRFELYNKKYNLNLRKEDYGFV